MACLLARLGRSPRAAPDAAAPLPVAPQVGELRGAPRDAGCAYLLTVLESVPSSPAELLPEADGATPPSKAAMEMAVRFTLQAREVAIKVVRDADAGQEQALGRPDMMAPAWLVGKQKVLDTLRTLVADCVTVHGAAVMRDQQRLAADVVHAADVGAPRSLFLLKAANAVLQLLSVASLLHRLYGAQGIAPPARAVDGRGPDVQWPRSSGRGPSPLLAPVPPPLQRTAARPFTPLFLSPPPRAGRRAARRGWELVL